MQNSNNITILYLDDEEINLFIFNANFKNKFNVITASSGASALKLLDEHQDEIIVVISDLNMPVMDGLKFINEAKKKHDQIYYYILTGFDYNKEIDHAIENKLINKFFSKPFDAKEIEKEILSVAQNL